jgi:hypothetical protein
MGWLTFYRFHGDATQVAASVNTRVEQARERTLLLEIAVGRPTVAGEQPAMSSPYSTMSVEH